MLLAEGPLNGLPPADVVVPVPLHPSRQRLRGYNQSALLGAQLANRLGLTHAPGALIRVRPTAPQVGLDAAARRQNVRDAFRCPDPAAVRGLNVWLVDDVGTTGATVTEAARVLRRAGARQIWAVAVAHD